MAKRTIAIRYFSFIEGDAFVEGHRGDKLDLSKDAIEYGDKIGAFTASAPAAAPEAPSAPDFSGMSVEEIEVFLREHKPTIPQVTNYVGDDAATARKVLAAEEAATGGQSRSTLVEGLNLVIEAGGKS